MMLFGSSSERVKGRWNTKLDVILILLIVSQVCDVNAGECWSCRELKKTKAHPLLDLKNLWEKSIEIQSNLPHKS